MMRTSEPPHSGVRTRHRDTVAGLTLKVVGPSVSHPLSGNLRCGARCAAMDLSPPQQVGWSRAVDPSTAKAVFLDVEGISKTYPARDGDPVHALERISCAIRAGEFASIL